MECTVLCADRKITIRGYPWDGTNEGVMVFSVAVRVPATIANLGPGFDCLGVALGLWLEARAESAVQNEFIYQGNGFVAAENNLMHTGWAAIWQELALPVPMVRITCQNPIPLARGLGSSSAALVAGAALADFVAGQKLGREGVLKVCAALEGHPDNVAPAVLGGFTASAMQDTLPVSVSLPLPAAWQVLVAIPDFELKTKQARAALPDAYAKADVIFTASRTALWVAALASQRFDLLQHACRDVLHQPQRAAFVPGLLETINAALEAGAVAAFLSGAGPSIAAIVEPAALESVKRVLSGFANRVEVLSFASGYEYEVLNGR